MSWRGESAALAILSFDVDAESPILAKGGAMPSTRGS